MIPRVRVLSRVMGLAVLGWQGWNAYRGTLVHFFLVADVVAGLVLILASTWTLERASAVGMLAGFSALAGVFLSATTGRILTGGYVDPGTILTTLGLIPCLLGAILLGRWLVKQESAP